MKTALNFAGLAGLVAHLLSASVVGAQDWPHWRGPNYDGSTEVRGLPTDFDLQTRVEWVVDLPGPGAATPVIVGDRVYCTAVEPEAGLLLAFCVERAGGEVRWKDSAGSGYRPGGKGSPTELHGRSDYASPSAVASAARRRVVSSSFSHLFASSALVEPGRLPRWMLARGFRAISRGVGGGL